MTGKVFARDGSGNYTCSATAVNSSSGKVIFTAAHCVRTKRWGWAKKLTFIPAYDRGEKPFGEWESRALYVPNGWSQLRYDYAAVSLERRNGRTIEQKVGGAGLKWNYKPDKEYRAFGFPFNFFNGERMMGCFSDLERVDGNSGAAPIGIKCRMASGASGGGWLIGNGYLASVISYGYDNDPSTIYGPYFTKRAKKFLNWVDRH
jgi:V8-like Glu-specific endopeptidase